MVQTAKVVGEKRYRESFGRHYEEFNVGDVYEHRPGRTITETDNTWFTLLTMNTHPMHFDAEYAKASEFGRCIVCSPFTVALMVGMSVTDVSQKAIANLGWTDIKLTFPLFAGDTLYAEVGSAREARVELAPRRRHRDRAHHRHQPGRQGGLHLQPHHADRQARSQRRGQGGLLMDTRTQDSDQQAFVDAVESWVEKELRPVAKKYDLADEYPHEIVEQMKELGLFGATIGEEYGGLGLSAWTYAQIVIKVAGAWMAPSGIFNSHLIMASAIERNGTEAQKREYLPSMASRRIPRQHRPHRAQLRLRPAGDPHRGPARRRPLRRQRQQDLDHQQPAWPRHPAAGEDRP